MTLTESTPLVTPALLRLLRNTAKLTQSELAERLGVSQAVLSRYESGEVAIPLELAVKLIDQLGLGMQMMVGEPKRGFAPLELNDPYLDYSVRLRLLREFITSESPEQKIGSELNSPSNLGALVDGLLQLPRMVIAGRSDAGKSHVCNCLLGSGVLPTAYQPVTRIPIALVHKAYRPPFITADCVMMRGAFDLKILLQQSKFQTQLVESGGLGLLYTGAVHTADDELDPGDVEWALAFLDSDTLRGCVMVDTPGFAASDIDANRAVEACRDAEILIYCSPAVGCFNSEDNVRVKNAMTALPCPEATDDRFPPLSNFLFVITHAGPQVTDDQLLKINKDVSRRFIKSFGDGLLSRRLNGFRGAPTATEVASRFVPFWGELESRHRDMRQKVLDTLREHFPRYRRNRADWAIGEFRKTASAANQSQIDEWKAFLNRWEESKRRVKEAESNEPRRKKWVTEQRKLVERAIEQHKQDSAAQFDIRYAAQLTPKNVESIIRGRYSLQDEAKNEIGAHILNELNDFVAADLGHRSKLLSEQINVFLKGYASGGGQLAGFGLKMDASPGFDAMASFAGGMAGLTTFGALAVWATMLGNLGGYIIVAKVVGLLAAIGIPTGGVATVVTAISALGGPVVLGVTLAILAAIAVVLFFWKSWQQRMAEKICEEFAKQDLCSKICDQIKLYWSDTLHAFRTAAAAVERDWELYFNDLKKIVEANSKEDIESRIRALEKLNDFFARLPWFPFRQAPGRFEGEEKK